MQDWQDLKRLHTGTPTQRAAVRALEQSNILDYLANFDPVLAGTFPLDIDIEGSDLDLLCNAPNLDQLEQVLTQHYSHSPDFVLYRKLMQGQPVVISQIHCCGFMIEVFGQALPIEKQYAFRHLLIEYRLLQIGGIPLRQRVRSLKRSGFKTEPAFAQIFHLPGNPYETLLSLEQLSDETLRRLILNFL